MTAIAHLNPETMPDAGKVGYSQISIVEPGRLAFISGQVAWNRDGGAQPGTLVEQAELVMKNARSALDAVDATPQDIVMIRIYIVGLTPERQTAIMPTFLAFLDGAQPSLTGVGVAALAGTGLELEMEMVVRLPN